MATESNDVVKQLQGAGLPLERYAAAVDAVSWMPSTVKQAIASARTPEETRAIVDVHLANKPGHNPDATSFLRALRNAHVPEPGKLLQLGPDIPNGLNVSLMFHPKYDALFVRDCYPRLFKVLMEEDTPVSYVVTGTPGIGKSMFFYYCVARLMQSDNPPDFIVVEHMADPGVVWCYVHETGEVMKGSRNDFEHAFKNPKAWYIVDGLIPKLACRGRTVLLTSPKYQTYAGLEKDDAAVLFMPFWELDELLQCRSLMYQTVDEALVRELYKHCGGVARHVLQRPKRARDRGLDVALRKLLTAVHSCSTEQMRNAIGSISSGPEVCHRLLHIIVDDDFCMVGLTFASKWVAEKFVEKAACDTEQGAASLLTCATGTLKGMIYEALMHSKLPRGGRYSAVPVYFDKRFRRGDPMELEFDPCERTESFTELVEVTKKHIYYKPSRTNFETVDSVACGSGTVDFFQMTVGTSKPLDAQALDRVLTQMKLPEDMPRRLHFVVPEDIYDTFTLTSGEKWATGQSTVVSRLRMYIVKG